MSKAFLQSKRLHKMRSFRLWKTWFLFGVIITYHFGCKDKNNYPKPKSEKEVSSNSVNEDQHEDESFTYSDSMQQVLSNVQAVVDKNNIDPDVLFDSLLSKAELYTSNNFDIKTQADTSGYIALTKEEKIYIIGTRLMGKLEGQIDTTLVILNQSTESHFGPSIELVKYYPSTKEFSKKLLSVEYLSENFEWYLKGEILENSKLVISKFIKNKAYNDQGEFTGRILSDTIKEIILL